MTVAVALAAILTLPMVALAVDTFADVPTTNTFHDEINVLYGARVVTGCATSPNALYCPSNAVTRGQMAGFLHRGLGRIGFNIGLETVDPENSPLTITSLPVTAGDIPGGFNLVKLDAAVEVSPASTDGCPCRAQAWIEDENGSTLVGSPRLTGELSTGMDFAQIPLTAVAVVPSGEAKTFKVVVELFQGTGSLSANATLTAVSAPFDSIGNAPTLDD